MDLLHLEEHLWILARPTGLPHYDFSFERYFHYRRGRRPDDLVSAVGRVGAILDYPRFYRTEWERGVSLIHTPEQHQRAADLTAWYPLIHDLTPKSIWATIAPATEQVEAELGWPVFIKGARQTSRHRRDFSHIDNADQYRRALALAREDPHLHWQNLIVREYVALRRVEDPLPHRIPTSYELRTFWWRGSLAGHGRYWWQGAQYTLTHQEKKEAIQTARVAAQRLEVPFLVVDVAQKTDGTWIVVECNDAQESGYTGLSPLALWRRILDLERNGHVPTPPPAGASPGDPEGPE